MSDLTWAPDACTLPTPERPTRLAEFDDLFATAVRGVERPSPIRARFALDPAAAARAAGLAVRESECCSFFTFTLGVTGGEVTLDVAVPERYRDVLDALAGRASAGMRA
ncbi:hypothetical protein [Phytohabitans suffuscus]|uniref:Arsenate reductase n=1 Tax=Phytohabitans suffuscus TaxID=624315 RepID=A0A6F8YQF1_9ACTN|nr:hypothetical protein [Phytohabitans suffuscus]BCB88279.1 hypothetical protein Psuf_055920 [Phytohabitans suffuscus]